MLPSLKVMTAAVLAATAQTMTLLPAAAEPMTSGAMQVAVRYRTAKVDGLDIFYREAGPATGPVLLLLHGFPSSSHMYRDLIPDLARQYRVIAPDYPGFGQSAQPAPSAFPYSFAALADVMDGFTRAVGASSYYIYMQDYGGPVGFRLAVKHPERVRGLIIQNAVANVEGWNGDVVKQFAPFWQARNAQTEKPIRAFLTAETTRFQYTQGAPSADLVAPEAWIVDQAGLDRPGNDAIQLELLHKYQDNVARYPEWQAYLKAHQPPTLIVWGRNDPFFTLGGVDYFKVNLPRAEVHLYDAGHFALETHGGEIAQRIQDFVARTHK